MTTSDYLALGALLISLASLLLSFHFGRLDRANLRLTSSFYPTHEGSEPYIGVRVANAGRRPVVLRMLGREFSANSWIGTYLGDGGKGLRLAENDFFETNLNLRDEDDLRDEGGAPARDLWFEDTVGRRYTVRGARENLRRLFDAR